MKYCIDYTIENGNTITIQGVWAKKNLIYIADETQKKLIYSSFVTQNVSVSPGSNTTTITVLSGAGVTLATTDVLTFTVDDFKTTQDIVNGISTDVGTVGGKVDAVSGKVDDITANIGEKNTEDLTIRQILSAIQANALTTTQLASLQTYLEGIITDVSNKIGTSSDDGTYSTLFGKIAAAKGVVDAVYTQLGIDANNNTVHAKLTELLRVVDLFAYGFSIEQNNDGTDTYTLNLDNSASIDDSTLNIA